MFLAAKVEEQPRKLEHVIKVAHACLHPQEPQLDTKSDVGGSHGFKDNQIICYVVLTGLLLPANWKTKPLFLHHLSLSYYLR